MRQKKLWMFAAIFFFICGACVITCCNNKDDNPVVAEQLYVPVAPDYDDPTMWVTAEGDALGTGRRTG